MPTGYSAGAPGYQSCGSVTSKVRRTVRTVPARTVIGREKRSRSPNLHRIRKPRVACSRVSEPRPHMHPRALLGPADLGLRADALDVDSLVAAQVDLAQDPAVVPPAAARPSVRALVAARDVRSRPPVVHPHDEPVDAVAHEARRGQLERHVAELVLAQEHAVQPDLRAVVHRLEAELPAERGVLRGQDEVLAIPPDRSALAVVGVVLRVPGARDRRRRPAVERRVRGQPRGLALVRRVEQEVPRPPMM